MITSNDKAFYMKWLKIMNENGSPFYWPSLVQKQGLPENEGKMAKIRLEWASLIEAIPDGKMDTLHRMSERGKLMLERGGWDEYFRVNDDFKRTFEEDREMMRKLHESTLNLNKKTGTFYTIQTVIAAGALLVAVFALFVAREQKIIRDSGRQPLYVNPAIRMIGISPTRKLLPPTDTISPMKDKIPDSTSHR